MNLQRRSTTAFLVAATCFVLVAGPAAATSITINAGDENVELDGDDVVITADDESRARISPEGGLLIKGRPVNVADRDRRVLARYNASVQRVQSEAVELGLQGAGLAFTALGEVIAGLASGDPDRVERRVEAKAEPLKEKARELCEEVRKLVQLQDTLASRIPAFRPYAVFDQDDADDCHVED